MTSAIIPQLREGLIYVASNTRAPAQTIAQAERSESALIADQTLRSRTWPQSQIETA